MSDTTMGAKRRKKFGRCGERVNCVPNGPELKYRVGVSALASFSSFSQG